MTTVRCGFCGDYFDGDVAAFMAIEREEDRLRAAQVRAVVAMQWAQLFTLLNEDYSPHLFDGEEDACERIVRMMSCQDNRGVYGHLESQPCAFDIVAAWHGEEP